MRPGHPAELWGPAAPSGRLVAMTPARSSALSLALLVVALAAEPAAGLKCVCLLCDSSNFTCQTEGACWASVMLTNGKEQVIKSCVSLPELNAQVFCHSSNNVTKTECCFTDFCNNITLHLPTVSPNAPRLGPTELTVVITVPVCLLSIAAMLTIWACQDRQCTYRKTKRHNVEEPLAEYSLVNAGKSLKDLIYDATASGSGSAYGDHHREPQLFQIHRTPNSGMVSLKAYIYNTAPTPEVQGASQKMG